MTSNENRLNHEFVWFIKGSNLLNTPTVFSIVESNPFHDTGESD